MGAVRGIPIHYLYLNRQDTLCIRNHFGKIIRCLSVLFEFFRYQSNQPDLVHRSDWKADTEIFITEADGRPFQHCVTLDIRDKERLLVCAAWKIDIQV